MELQRFLADGWHIDAWRNSVPGSVVFGWPQRGYVGMKLGDLPWLIRKQHIFHCAVCNVEMPAGPDIWAYCAHNQPDPAP